MSSSILTKVIVIENMTCVNCENIIEQTLSKIAGIERVKASYSSGTATITYDTERITLEQIDEILRDHDYHLKKEASGNRTDNIKKQNISGQQMDITSIIGIGIIIFALYTVANRFGLLNIFNVFPTVKEGMGYGMLLLIGLLTSVHCVAMCGGICISQCVKLNNEDGVSVSKFAALRPSLLYNLGRVISYTVIGGIVGAIGSVISFSGPMKGLVQIIAGVFMVIMGLNMLNIFPWLRKFNPRMPKIIAKKIYAQKLSNSPLYIGILNGLMPCGPLQAMQLYALSTGSPLKGAVSMFLFSVGTVPLMFAFGALSSLLSKKFTHKMMSVSAVLVVILGVFMFNQGVGLSGINFSINSSANSKVKAENIARIKDGVQIVTTGLNSGRYESITVQKGIPVIWTIQAVKGDINGCNNSIVVPKYELQKDLNIGDNVIEFTPTESGVIPYSCWMGMIRSKITVVDDLSKVEGSSNSTKETATSNQSNDNTQSAEGAQKNNNTPNADNSSSDNINPLEESNGLGDLNNLLDIQIPTEEVAVAEIVEGVQKVTINLDENGFSPALIVMQRDLETIWTIKASEINSDIGNVMFPYYYAKLEVYVGDNPINLNPYQDFDFYTADNSYYGYVKVVEDINNIDLEAIKKEVSEYRPSDNSSISFGTGGASCH
jgi:sulfite exporter TauE/SafE/copper chaperone CopZ